MVVASIVGVILLAVCVAIGLAFPIELPKTFWIILVFVYIMIASVTPVWILLRPRDYLSSFLLYFMIIAAVIGIFGAHPAIQIPAYIGFHVGNNYLFPTLFITIACGAISGFHSLIGSGTTSKQLDNEKDALLVGYGSMLIECVLAVISLIAVATLTSDGQFAVRVTHLRPLYLHRQFPASLRHSVFQKVRFLQPIRSLRLQYPASV